MDKFLNGLKDATNYTLTENGAVTHKTTKSNLLDLFAMGAAMRNRSDADVNLMFEKAFKENPKYALKCLFYIRDIRGGQGERRFFRVVLKNLAFLYPDAVIRNLENIPEYGRWDDLYCLVDTPVEEEMFSLIKKQLNLDVSSKTPSLLAKWLKSENASSAESAYLGNKTRKYLNLTHKQYRKTLSILRERINVLERLMSQQKWDEIEFDKIPSKAGLVYRNAFARHDVDRMISQVKDLQSYADFAKDETKTVNAKTLYPYECVEKAFRIVGYGYYGRFYQNDHNEIERLMVNKYWDNLADYFNNAPFNGLAVVDTSGSMYGTPLNVAVSLGLYCAEKGKGPFANHFLTFSSTPELVQVEGKDFCEKVRNMSNANWGCSTNIKAAFDLMLKTALSNKCTQDDIPQNLIIISDMEFDSCARTCTSYDQKTLMENIEKEWSLYGYKMPHLIFWNVDARHNNIPMIGEGPISYVSGFSPSIFESILSGKTGYELMMEKLDSERYAAVE